MKKIENIRPFIEDNFKNLWGRTYAFVFREMRSSKGKKDLKQIQELEFKGGFTRFRQMEKGTRTFRYWGNSLYPPQNWDDFRWNNEREKIQVIQWNTNNISQQNEDWKMWTQNPNK